MPARRQGFSLMFYGLGSKRSLLNTFAAEALTDGGVLAFNAWQPAVTAKTVSSRAVAMTPAAQHQQWQEQQWQQPEQQHQHRPALSAAVVGIPVG
jgi:hypothetical protein